MWVKLPPELVSTCWNELRDQISESLPPTISFSQQRMSNILEALISEDMTLWVAVRINIEEERVGVLGHAITKIVEDEITETRNLMLFTLWSGASMTRRDFEEGISVGRRYAEKKGCENITAYASNESIIKTSKRFGFDNEWRVLVLPVKGEYSWVDRDQEQGAGQLAEKLIGLSI